MKIFVAGGLGYVGGRVCRRLIQEGYSVTIGTRQPRQSLPSWLRGGQLVGFDPKAEEPLLSRCLDGNFDCIINFVGVSNRDAANDPLGAFQTNVLSARRLLDEAAYVKAKKFFQFSTIHVYGSSLSGIVTESTLPRPTHPYGILHRTAEDFVLAHDGPFQKFVIRLANSFGAPLADGVDRRDLLINDLCAQAAASGKVILKSTGEQLRDFIPLRAIEDILVRLIASSTHDEAGIINLASGKTMSVFCMAELIAERYRLMTGQGLKIERGNLRETIVPFRFDISRLIATGWLPETSFERELDEILAFYLRGKRPAENG